MCHTSLVIFTDNRNRSATAVCSMCRHTTSDKYEHVLFKCRMFDKIIEANNEKIYVLSGKKK